MPGKAERQWTQTEIRGSLNTGGEKISVWGQSNCGEGCLVRLCGLHLWKFSRLDWETKMWITLSDSIGKICFEGHWTKWLPLSEILFNLAYLMILQLICEGEKWLWESPYPRLACWIAGAHVCLVSVDFQLHHHDSMFPILILLDFLPGKTRQVTVRHKETVCWNVAWAGAYPQYSSFMEVTLGGQNPCWKHAVAAREYDFWQLFTITLWEEGAEAEEMGFQTALGLYVHFWTLLAGILGAFQVEVQWKCRWLILLWSATAKEGNTVNSFLGLTGRSVIVLSRETSEIHLASLPVQLLIFSNQCQLHCFLQHCSKAECGEFVTWRISSVWEM